MDANNPRPSRLGRFLYPATILLTALVTFGLAALLMNINERKREGAAHFVQLVPLDESTVDPAVWGKNFPHQYDGYKRTAEMVGDRHGHNESFSKLEKDPVLIRMFAGYAFGVDFRELRGHAYMLSDQDVTERTKKFKQPGACLHCHASIIPTYREEGGGDVMKGFEKVCAIPLADARKLVAHPVACIDCHDPKTMQLRVTRPGFLNGIKELAKSDYPLPHLATIEKWRQGKRETDYDPNAMASRQELRSFVCGQCHVEYYFKGNDKLLTYPWHRGLKVEQMEKYYDDAGFKDWVHAETGAEVLKAQHPEFEMWNQGVHARSGVACADCHMPFQREGAVKLSDHHVRSPLLNIARACQTCHRISEEEIKGRVTAIQGRTRELKTRAETALLQMMDAIREAKDNGLPADKLSEARALHRKAQWRLDFVLSENSLGFHAPQESARILGEAIDFARQGQIKVMEKRREKASP